MCLCPRHSTPTQIVGNVESHSASLQIQARLPADIILQRRSETCADRCGRLGPSVSRLRGARETDAQAAVLSKPGASGSRESFLARQKVYRLSPTANAENSRRLFWAFC